jgi:hypothetical protein
MITRRRETKNTVRYATKKRIRVAPSEANTNGKVPSWKERGRFGVRFRNKSSYSSAAADPQSEPHNQDRSVSEVPRPILLIADPHYSQSGPFDLDATQTIAYSTVRPFKIA